MKTLCSLLVALLTPLWFAHAGGVVRQWAVTYVGADELDESNPLVAVDSAGNVVVAATSVSGLNRQDFYTAK